MATKTLTICGEPTIPGLTLPKAFEELEKQFETIANICSLKGSHESQTTGLLILCHELQRLLRLSFVENGILASRIEILSRYQDECVKKTEKRLRSFETEQKITKRNLNKLRKRQYNYEKVKKSKDKEWWKVDVSSSDYDSLSGLSRITGNPNLEFMLRLNQLLLDFVKDPYTNELLLPPMGSEERAELSKLASLYKLRCRFNKSTQVATSTLIKARQTCIPASGEVDSILNTFTKKQKDSLDAELEAPSSPKEDTTNKDTASTTVPTGTAATPASSGPSKKSNNSKQSTVVTSDVKKGETKKGEEKKGDEKKGEIKKEEKKGEIKKEEKKGEAKKGEIKKGEEKKGEIKKGEEKKGDPKKGEEEKKEEAKKEVKKEEAKKNDTEVKETQPLPSYMLTPVSVMGTPTITLEGDNTSSHIKTSVSTPTPPPPLPPPDSFNRSSPTSKLDNILSLSPSVRVTKLDNRPFVQVLPSGGVVGGAPSSLHPLERSLEASSVASSKTSNVNPVVATLPTASTTSPSSAYTNLLTSASTSPAALHMALLMQSQQLRALTAAVTAGQTPSIPPASVGGSSLMTSPVIPSSSSNTTSGISTVLATPLPKSLTGSGPTTGGRGNKREGNSTGSSSSKRYKTNRRGNNEQNK